MIAFGGGSIDPRRWQSFENLVIIERASSSNDLAREMIELYFAEDQRLPATVLLAQEQTAARGRKGQWAAPHGRGVYLTFVRKAPAGEPISLVPIAVGRWVREALSEGAGIEASLKWPNDVYSGGRKLAGILAESRTQGDETYVAVGLGLNVLGRSDALGVPGATTIEEETGRTPDLPAIVQAILDRIDGELACPGWKEEVGRWERVALHRPGDRLTVRREGEEVSGEYRGLTPEGFLRLQTGAGETVVAVGELARW